jgi:carboxymethylenebutenolidase
MDILQLTASVETPDGVMPVFEARPKSEPRGAVLVIQEAFGVNDHIQDVATRFAAEGWLALAPHLFHRDGAPVVEYGDVEKALIYTRRLTATGLEANLSACLAHLAERGFEADRVAIVGFCMGGTVAFFAATRFPLGAAATFYGGGVEESRWPGVRPLIELAASLQTPWLGLYGDQDHGIPTRHVDRLEAAVGEASVPAEVVRYPEAGHGFHCDARPEAYDPASARDAWGRTLRWFERHIAS